MNSLADANNYNGMVATVEHCDEKDIAVVT
jgi:hypothetical protein